MTDPVSRVALDLAANDRKQRVWNFSDPTHRILMQDVPGLKGCVFTNGCFDGLHAGHVMMLATIGVYSLMDDSRMPCRTTLLRVVGLNSDRSVSALKGMIRPLFDQAERAEMLLQTGMVDHVVIFDEDAPIDLIGFLQPIFYMRREHDVDLTVLMKSQLTRFIPAEYSIEISTSKIIDRVITKLFEPRAIR